MKTKFNGRFPVLGNQTEHGSIIQNQFKSEINTLLTPSAGQITQVNFENLYIPNADMETPLAKYKSHTEENNVCIVEGLTGCGKSMLIRHVFDVHSISARISGASLIIPFNFNHTQYDKIENAFIKMLRGACDCLKERFPQVLNSDTHPEEFYAFVRKFNLGVFEDEYPTPAPLEQLKTFHRIAPFQFRCAEMKFYLNQRDAIQIDNVIIIVDDIEGIMLNELDVGAIDSDRIELLPIKMTIELIKTLQEATGAAVPWSLNAVICCRHYVSRMMKTLPYSRSPEREYSYISELMKLGYFECIDFEQSKSAPTILQIIQRRYSVLCATEKNQNEKWRTAMDIVLQILQRIDSRIGLFILDLTLSNHREAMDQIKKLVFNRQWLQNDWQDRGRKNDSSANFSMSLFHVTSASLVRAIGMSESKVYNSIDSIIPNLLYNDPVDDTELFVLLTLKHFRYKAQFEVASWKTSIRISAFFERIKRLFCSEEYEKRFRNSVRYLLKNRLLLRSYDQEQADNKALSSQDLDSIEYVYVSKLTESMWLRLANSSVLFEMFVDDIWMENDSRVAWTIPDVHGFNDANFQVCIDYMDLLIAAERRVFCRAANVDCGDVSFVELFGNTPICAHLLKGLESSLDVFYARKSLNAEESYRINRWREKIQVLKAKCRDIYSTAD